MDARKTADLVRFNLLSACYVAPRVLSYRNVVAAESVRMKNNMSGLLMEMGAEYNKQPLHGEESGTRIPAYLYAFDS